MRIFYEQVSAIAREYLGNRYGFLALDMTTSEILKTVRQLQPAGLDAAQVARFLAEADLVKFAKFVPGAEEPAAHLAEARRLVDTTRELDAPAAPQQAAA